MLAVACLLTLGAVVGGTTVGWLIDVPDSSQWRLQGCAQVAGLECDPLQQTHSDGMLVSSQFYTQLHLTYGVAAACLSAVEADCILYCVQDMTCLGYSVNDDNSGWILYYAGNSHQVAGPSLARCGSPELPCPSDELVTFEFSPVLNDVVYFVMELHGVRVRCATTGLDQTDGMVVMATKGSITTVTVSLQAVTPGAYATSPVLLTVIPTKWKSDKYEGTLIGVIMTGTFVLIVTFWHLYDGIRMWRFWRKKTREDAMSNKEDLVPIDPLSEVDEDTTSLRHRSIAGRVVEMI